MTGMILRLLLKMSLPLALLVGSLSYGLHLRGGDPLALLAQVAGGIGRDVADSGRDMGAMAGSAVEQLSGDDRGRGGNTVQMWVDENGVTHFDNGATRRAGAIDVTLAPDRNLLRAVQPTVAAPSVAGNARRPVPTSVSGPVSTRGSARGDDRAAPAALPGLAGIALPEGADREALLELLNRPER